ncbi:MAG TPA: hypothetical protein VEZ88_13320 [Steroidobacteraceae bacterium]|nr:hypothetical protein [Steroidobacteraceae bacterium]
MTLENLPVIPRSQALRVLFEATGAGPATYHRAVASGRVKPHVVLDTEREYLSFSNLRELMQFANRKR